MKVTKVCCQSCGADLQVDETIRYVTCNYCQCQLEVVHDSTVTHTLKLDKIERTTDQLAKKLRLIELQNDVEHIDREWDKFRAAVLSRDNQGQLCEPSSSGSIMVGIFGIGSGVLWIIFCASNGSPAWALAGLVIIGIAICLMKDGGKKAEIYRIQRYRYESARKSLLYRIDGERGE